MNTDELFMGPRQSDPPPTREHDPMHDDDRIAIDQMVVDLGGGAQTTLGAIVDLVLRTINVPSALDALDRYRRRLIAEARHAEREQLSAAISILRKIVADESTDADERDALGDAADVLRRRALKLDATPLPK